MPNHLKMEKKETVLALLRLGWSYRKIERETGVRRETISKYDPGRDSKAARVATGNPETRPQWPPGSSSRCEPFRELIVSKLALGLEAKRIHQDLVFEHGFSGAYNSVKRFCRHLRKTKPEVFARIEVAPGQEMQVDFGKGALTRSESGKYRRPHVFKAVLSFSRHSYEEAVWRQDLATFLRCFENAFQFFGGLVDTVRIDNLKAGITQACFFDPDVNEVFAAFARHYGFAVLPIRPRTPRENGKVERVQGYTFSSALKGRRFENLEEQNRHLEWWNGNVARWRIHGTTREQVWARFQTQERGALKPLPTEPFRFFRTGRRTVSPDGHVEVERAFYSVPHRYLGLQLRVDWDSSLIRIYHGREQVAVHARIQRGFQTNPSHLPEEKRYVHYKLEGHLLQKAAHIGREARLWAEAALEERGVLAYRLLQGMLSLTRKYPPAVVNRACQAALGHHAFRYRTLIALCKRQKPEQPSLFRSEHELIRPLSEYTALLEKGDPE